MLFNNKKAISPLVATILLIAFAASIGALIMNWSSSEDTSIPLPIVESGCNAVNLQVVNVCADKQNVVFTLENSGSQKIEKIVLRSKVGNSNLDYIVPQSAILKNTESRFSVSNEYINSINDISIIPVIFSNNNELLCTTKIVKQIQVGSC